jgi:hypothetical protein
MRPGGFVPEGHLIIARRFNAGEARKGTLVPKGRLRTPVAFSRPFGTDLLFGFAHPALKRRAILGGPSGAKRRREPTDSSNRSVWRPARLDREACDLVFLAALANSRFGWGLQIGN